MNDLLGGLQEVRRLLERHEKAEDEKSEKRRMQDFENRRDSFAMEVMKIAYKEMKDSSCDCIANAAYGIADAMMRRRQFVDQQSCQESVNENTWHLGPPPARDDGKMILVMLSPQSYEGGGGDLSRWAFVVRCYAKGVSTINGNEWAYPSIAAWCEVPK